MNAKFSLSMAHRTLTVQHLPCRLHNNAFDYNIRKHEPHIHTTMCMEAVELTWIESNKNESIVEEKKWNREREKKPSVQRSNSDGDSNAKAVQWTQHIY